VYWYPVVQQQILADGSGGLFVQPSSTRFSAPGLASVCGSGLASAGQTTRQRGQRHIATGPAYRCAAVRCPADLAGRWPGGCPASVVLRGLRGVGRGVALRSVVLRALRGGGWRRLSAVRDVNDGPAPGGPPPNWDGPPPAGGWNGPPPAGGWNRHWDGPGRDIAQARIDFGPFNYNGYGAIPVFNPVFGGWGFWFFGVWIPLY
jgi:hypothetical protein